MNSIFDLSTPSHMMMESISRRRIVAATRVLNHTITITAKRTSVMLLTTNTACGESIHIDG